MATNFDRDIDTLVTVLAAGGYVVRTIQTIPQSRGRCADLYLNNGVVVCWDSFTRKIWVERLSFRGRRVEAFLDRMSAWPASLRPLAIVQSRLEVHLQMLHQSTAFWLLRSQSLLARSLRERICRG